eukprot:762734-Hanusia_phi.AAC.8
MACASQRLVLMTCGMRWIEQMLQIFRILCEYPYHAARQDPMETLTPSTVSWLTRLRGSVCDEADRHGHTIRCYRAHLSAPLESLRRLAAVGGRWRRRLGDKPFETFLNQVCSSSSSRNAATDDLVSDLYKDTRVRMKSGLKFITSNQSTCTSPSSISFSVVCNSFPSRPPGFTDQPQCLQAYNCISSPTADTTMALSRMRRMEAARAASCFARETGGREGGREQEQEQKQEGCEGGALKDSLGSSLNCIVKGG